MTRPMIVSVPTRPNLYDAPLRTNREFQIHPGCYSQKQICWVSISGAREWCDENARPGPCWKCAGTLLEPSRNRVGTSQHRFRWVSISEAGSGASKMHVPENWNTEPRRDFAGKS